MKPTIQWMAMSCILLAGVIACTKIKANETETKSLKGAVVAMGEGTLETFGEIDKDGNPLKIGVSFSKEALDSPPTTLSDGNRCFDHDNSGSIDTDTECMPWHERVIPLPATITRNVDMPFKWALVNWNLEGHIPDGIWNEPHFDVHFYIAPIEKIFGLQRGDCGPEFLRCDQYEIATKPVPDHLMHPDYINVGAAAPAMGNHLVDTTAAEFSGTPFTRSWIYGVYDAEVIFYEEMLAQSYMQTLPNDCFPIKTTPEVALSGYYPETVCTRHDESSGGVAVSLEDFVYRTASNGS
ncbi:hypothetical protein [Gracilimonas mengyeensis]|uniref:DUF5602 domain-containing protein n=1 Tax=Gracilimonas mengyeensis TaxID=1302730 RepID=A0A521B573_9BACT|nr:hypothetical protein [Gracilimonas mengyeensis]SMO42244.1 hypothetical protein SAMN06265219_10225 [Gracilimonas mengyeensis]